MSLIFVDVRAYGKGKDIFIGHFVIRIVRLHNHSLSSNWTTREVELIATAAPV
jgi:hypothetical protein